MYSFETFSGHIEIQHEICAICNSQICVQACKYGILKLEKHLPVLKVEASEVKKGKCPECLACELECEFKGKKALKIYLPIQGLNH